MLFFPEGGLCSPDRCAGWRRVQGGSVPGPSGGGSGCGRVISRGHQYPQAFVDISPEVAPATSQPP